MVVTKELKRGWLQEDMDRAERQVNEWKIKKYNSSTEDEDNQKSDEKQTSNQDFSHDLNC